MCACMYVCVCTTKVAKTVEEREGDRHIDRTRDRQTDRYRQTTEMELSGGQKN